MRRTYGLLQRIGRRRRLRLAVKEALDNMPAAVCYFTAAGIIKLCNRSMYHLYGRLAHKDLQSWQELQETLRGCEGREDIVRDGDTFVFPDGRAWQYREQEIHTADGGVYREVLFIDVTKLYETKRRLEKQTAEYEAMQQELTRLAENVRDAARERELLNLKTRIHDRMNMGTSVIRQVLRQNVITEESRGAIGQLYQAVQMLRGDLPGGLDCLTDFVLDAEAAGVRIEFSGLPAAEIPYSELLLTIMREACANAVRHADATVLYIEASQTMEEITLHITNNGRQPEAEIVPQGGLADLENRIAETGGRMELRARPAFRLTAVLPRRDRAGRWPE